MARTVLVALALARATTALSLSGLWGIRSASSAKRDSTVAATQTLWVVEDIYQGSNFFDNFDFFSDGDPTHGMVNYVDRDTALNNGFAFVQDGQVTMKVDNWTTLQPGQYRDSVRIQSKKLYNGGLFILDLKRSPFGCSVWPGYWTLGMSSTWPAGGEIDIVEGVHNNEHDQVTWHTSPGCNLTTPGNFSGTALSTDCVANETGGCGIVDWSRSSYGPLFNQLGGGVYAMKWDDESIDVWFFYRAAIPSDILIGAPNPTTEGWGLPSASMSSQNCDLRKYFVDHAIVFDMTICGDWAGPSYSQEGCPGTCADAVVDPTNFDNASWVLNSLNVYRKTTLQGRISSSGAQLTAAVPMATALLTAAIAWFSL